MPSPANLVATKSIIAPIIAPQIITTQKDWTASLAEIKLFWASVKIVIAINNETIAPVPAPRKRAGILVAKITFLEKRGLGTFNKF